MIEHIVLFRWKSEATDAQVARVMEELRSLPERVPGILSLACGADFSDRAQGYTHALAARFPDRAALDAYDSHPAHRAVIETHVLPILGDALGFDFEAAPQG